MCLLARYLPPSLSTTFNASYVFIALTLLSSLMQPPAVVHPRSPNPLQQVTVATLNVRGLSSETKKIALVRDMTLRHVDICALQETKVSDVLDRRIDGARILTFLPVTPARGLGFCIGRRFDPFLTRAWSVSGTERIAVAVFRFPLPKGQHFELRAINVYAPTSPDTAANPQERDKLYELLSKAVSEFKNSRGLTIILGDFNAKVGCRRQGETCIGRYAVGQRNENGYALVNFAESHSLLFANTCFCHPARHITTWTGTAKQGRLVYNQIDYIALPLSFRASLQQARAYAGIETETDHKMVCAEIQLKHVRILWGRGKNTIRTPPFCLDRLEDNKQRFNEVTQQAFLAKADSSAERSNWECLCKLNTPPSIPASSGIPLSSHSSSSLSLTISSTINTTTTPPVSSTAHVQITAHPPQPTMPPQAPDSEVLEMSAVTKRDRRPHFALPMIQMPRPPRKKRSTVGTEPKEVEEKHTVASVGAPTQEAAIHPQHVLEGFVEALVSAAEATIGRTPKALGSTHDPILLQLSSQQKHLRVRINNTSDPPERLALRRQRMLLLRAVHIRARLCANTRIDEQTREIENAKDNTQCFLAARHLRSCKPLRLIIHDSRGREIKNDKEKATEAAKHFAKVFLAPPGTPKLSSFDGPPRPLMSPITDKETAKAIDKLKRRRASGPDGVPAELLKACEFAPSVLTCIFNNVFAHHQQIQVGHGIIVPLPKPGKPPGPCKSLRPITLLTTVRKVLSLIVVNRVRPRFEARLPPGQAGARPYRSTADGVWTKRMLTAMVIHYQIELHSLGTDISQAFDSVDRQHLLAFFESDGWMSPDECRMTRFLLANTTLQVRVGCTLSDPFDSTVGTIQGDALSILIFIGYLAGAQQNIKKAICNSIPSMDLALHLPNDTTYVDDADYHSTSCTHLEKVLTVADAEFPSWNMNLNIAKTERTRIFLAPTRNACARCAKPCHTNATCCDTCSSWWHNECAGITEQMFKLFVTDPTAHWVCSICISGDTPTSRGSEPWRKVRHLGSLLDTAADVSKRIQSANSAFATLNKMWMRRNLVSEKKRIQLFKAFVLPHITYNLCTQALTKPLENRMDVAHRKLLRRTIGVFYPNKISNENLYKRTESDPISKSARAARWRYFGHILRRKKEEHPAAMATFSFFRAANLLSPRPSAPKNSIIHTLRADLKESEHLHAFELGSLDDLEVLCEVAEDRKQWDVLMTQVCSK